MRYLIPWVFSLAGLMGTVGATLIMNKTPPPKVRTVSNAAATFTLAPTPPPPKPKAQPKPRPKQVSAPPPPLPMMNHSLAGMSFGMESLTQDFSLGGADLIADQAGVVMTSETVDVPPRPIQRTAPKYPRKARKKGMEGYVVLSILVDESGGIQDVMIVDSQPVQEFEQAALEAVRTWVFRPGEYKGSTVPVRVTQTLRFELG